jgi:hypothetical protein
VDTNFKINSNPNPYPQPKNNNYFLFFDEERREFNKEKKKFLKFRSPNIPLLNIGVNQEKKIEENYLLED